MLNRHLIVKATLVKIGETMKDINQKQGPRTGNQARAGKRDAFKAEKGVRANLANSINNAFKARNPGVTVKDTLESVKDSVNTGKK